jgi:hypothetical protein
MFGMFGITNPIGFDELVVAEGRLTPRHFPKQYDSQSDGNTAVKLPGIGLKCIDTIIRLPNTERGAA